MHFIKSQAIIDFNNCKLIIIKAIINIILARVSMILFNFTWIKFKINKNIFFTTAHYTQLKIKTKYTMSTTHANKIDIIKAATSKNK
jgi:hypothetical protein